MKSVKFVLMNPDELVSRIPHIGKNSTILSLREFSVYLDIQKLVTYRDFGSVWLKLGTTPTPRARLFCHHRGIWCHRESTEHAGFACWPNGLMIWKKKVGNTDG